jgi:hypothetical protein
MNGKFSSEIQVYIHRTARSYVSEDRNHLHNYGDWELSAEENTCTQGNGSNRRTEKIT